MPKTIDAKQAKRKQSKLSVDDQSLGYPASEMLSLEQRIMLDAAIVETACALDNQDNEMVLEHMVQAPVTKETEEQHNNDNIPAGYAYTIGGEYKNGKSGGQQDAILYRINLTEEGDQTGNAVSLGHLDIVDKNGTAYGFTKINDAEALALNPQDGKLYALITEGPIQRKIVVIDVAATLANYEQSLTDNSVTPHAEGYLLGDVYAAQDIDDKDYQTFLAKLSQSNAGFTVSPNGDLWVGDNAGTLSKLEVATGVVTEFTVAGGPKHIDALAIDATGILYAVDEYDLYRIDPSVSTSIAESLPIKDIYGGKVKYLAGLSFDSEGNLWAIHQKKGALYKIEPNFSDDATHVVATYSTQVSLAEDQDLSHKKQRGDGFENLAIDMGCSTNNHAPEAENDIDSGDDTQDDIDSGGDTQDDIGSGDDTQNDIDSGDDALSTDAPIRFYPDGMPMPLSQNLGAYEQSGGHDRIIHMASTDARYNLSATLLEHYDPQLGDVALFYQTHLQQQGFATWAGDAQADHLAQADDFVTWQAHQLHISYHPLMGLVQESAVGVPTSTPGLPGEGLPTVNEVSSAAEGAAGIAQAFAADVPATEAVDDDAELASWSAEDAVPLQSGPNAHVAYHVLGTVLQPQVEVQKLAFDGAWQTASKAGLSQVAADATDLGGQLAQASEAFVAEQDAFAEALQAVQSSTNQRDEGS